MAGRGQTCGAEGVTKVTPPIASGRFRPELQDPHEVAQILWSSRHGLVSLRIAKEHDDWVQWRDVQATATRLQDVMFMGLLRRGRASLGLT